MKLHKGKCSAILIFFVMTLAYAQDTIPKTAPSEPSGDETLKQANNPMAQVKAINVQTYYIPKLYGIDNASSTQFLLRYAQPVGKFIFRATMPFVKNAMPAEGPISGLGDFNMFAIYSAYENNGHQLGIGPSVTAPTGTQNLGTGKWQAGVCALAFFARNHQLQTGTLLTWQTSFAGDDERADINMLTTQLFFIWQLGKGTCIRSTGAWTFDLESGNYNIPAGLGIGQVLKVNKTVFNIFMEPQYSVLAEGIGQPELQLFIGFNMQF